MYNSLLVVSTYNDRGSLKVALVAAPPSPVYPLVEVPATLEITPVERSIT